MDQTYKITPCPAEQRADALRVLHSGLTNDQQAAFVQAIDTIRNQNATDFDGLLVACEAEKIDAAAWVQLTGGRTAVLWPPDYQKPQASALMEAVAKFLDRHRVSLAQFLVSNDSQVNSQVMAAGGFSWLVNLAYLTIDCDSYEGEVLSPQITWYARASEQAERLGRVLQQTYQHSLDCPQLNGVRSIEDVLDGYRGQGRFASERWFFAQQDKHDIGVLILTEHPDTGNWELVYMGLVPEARGNQLGQEILSFAVQQAKAGGAKRLVLAVDESNKHALRMYQQAGFKAWDHRCVYARLSAET